MNNFPNDLMTSAKDLAVEFATLRDRMRVKSHLFKMESKDAVERLERQLDQVEQGLDRFLSKASDKSEEVRLEAALGFMEAKERYNDLRQHMEELAQQAKSQSKTSVDEARLQAHLAKMEVSDYWQEKSGEWRSKLSQGAEQGVAEVKAGLHSLENGIKSVLGLLPPK